MTDEAPPAPNRIKVRSVLGRPASPFRGTVGGDDPLGAREPSPPRSFEEIRAAIESIPNAHVTVDGGQVSVCLSPHSSALSIQCPEGDLGLEDMWLLGNESIAIAVIEALVPLFGPVAIDIGGYTDLLDGTEWGAATRYEQRAQSNEVETASPARTLQHAVADEVADRGHAERRSWWATATNPLITVVSLLLLGGGWYLYNQFALLGMGSVCSASDACRSGKCLPNDTFDPNAQRSNTVPTEDAHAKGPGICTEVCGSASDCPPYMTCRTAVGADGFKPFGANVSVCAPKTVAD